MKKLILLATLFVSIFANAQTRDTTYDFNFLKITTPIYICDSTNSITIHCKKNCCIFNVVIQIYTPKSGIFTYLVDDGYYKRSNYINPRKGFAIFTDYDSIVVDSIFTFSLDSFLINTNPNNFTKNIGYYIAVFDLSSPIQQPMINPLWIKVNICTPTVPIDTITVPTGIESVSDKKVLQTNYINYLGQSTNECRPCIEELIFDDGSRQRKQVSY